MTDVRLLMVLTENEALTGTTDPAAVVDLAVLADQHGIAGNAQFAPQRVAVCTGAGQRLRVKAIGDDV